MLPPAGAFAAAAAAVGAADAAEPVVLYDGAGVAFASARAWFMFKALGHPRVAVLDGGLPGWKAAGGPVEATPVAPEAANVAAAAAEAAQREGAGGGAEVPEYFAPGGYAASTVTLADVQRNLASREFTVVDARSAGRFAGEAPEPRPIPSGHIRGSFNVPFTDLLQDGFFKSPAELAAAFERAGVDARADNLVVSCGTGVTACVLALALAVCGNDAVRLYDGSWSEWAVQNGTEILKGDEGVGRAAQ